MSSLDHIGPAKPIMVLYGPAPTPFQGPIWAPRVALRTDRSLWPWTRCLTCGSDCAATLIESRTAQRAGAVWGYSMITWYGSSTGAPHEQATDVGIEPSLHLARSVAHRTCPNRSLRRDFLCAGLGIDPSLRHSLYLPSIGQTTWLNRWADPLP